jgi:hypothetical protein
MRCKSAGVLIWSNRSGLSRLVGMSVYFDDPLDERMRRLEQLIHTGVASTTVDGESATIDLVEARRALYKLEVANRRRKGRARVMNVDMSQR